ncbi:hypothetical protein OHA68_36075 [Nonomuraea glycinis]|uniref:hypothetical protein n=1 Tax=Nonomuraea glycinis TaxID=2047744 RepID=UPI002E128AD8|nr:hypothetical protein OHA68_36075 [Nonomuraea glycinis]
MEQHITRLGLPATFLRPVSFMENHTGPTTRTTAPWPLRSWRFAVTVRDRV